MKVLQSASLAACALSSLACASTTRIEKVRWHDQDAYRLSNDIAEAVVVPAWRRVMHYSLLGKPNVLWTGAETDFKVAPNAWPNYGGEKAWLWPQSEWTGADGTKRGWPPPNDNTTSVGDTVVRTDFGELDVSGPISRTYSLDKSGALLITAAAAGTEHLAPQRWATWSIVQLPRPLRVTAHLDGDRKTQTFSGTPAMTIAGTPAMTISGDGQHAAIETAVEKAAKVGLDANMLTAEYATYAVSVRIDREWIWQSPGTYEPAERAQVYLTPTPKKPQDVDYVELELTSPRQVSADYGPRMRVVLSIDEQPRKQ